VWRVREDGRRGMAKDAGNLLYYGDNLDVLRRHVADEGGQ
jgi:hypothetical protein